MTSKVIKYFVNMVEDDRKHLERLQREEEELKAKMAELREWIVVTKRILGRFKVDVSLDNNSSEAEEHKSKTDSAWMNGRGNNGNGGVKVGDVAYQLIAMKGGPISVTDLYKQLEFFGKKVKREGLPSALNRDNRFVRVARGTYDLVR